MSFNSPPKQPEFSAENAGQNLWWNAFDKDNISALGFGAESTAKPVAGDPTESASSARSSLLFPESMRASSSSSELEEEEQDDVDSENASTTTDNSSTAARRRDPQKRLGGTMTALSGATLLLEAETDPEDAESVSAEPGSLEKKGRPNSVWNITNEQRRYYLREFAKLQPNLAGFIPGLLAKQYFLRSELPNQVLAEIWAMSDLDADGALNVTEFCCAMHLVVAVRNGVHLPSILPPDLFQSALQIADRIEQDPAYRKKSGEKSSNASSRPVPAIPSSTDVPPTAVATEPWPTNTGGDDGSKQALSFPSNIPADLSRASSMASNLASFDDRPPASALYPYAVRPAPALPTQIPPPPPPRRPQPQPPQQPANSPPMNRNQTAALPSLLTSHAVSVSASSLQPLIPINDSASITSATSDSSQLQLLVPPIDQLRTRNQQLAQRYRELVAELERIRMERTTLQTRLKQFRTMTNGGHGRHNAFEQASNVLSSGELKSP